MADTSKIAALLKQAADSGDVPESSPRLRLETSVFEGRLGERDLP